MEMPRYNSLEEKKLFFTCQTIDNKTALFDTIAMIRKKGMRKNHIYRGVNSASFKLYTAAQRKWIENDLYRTISYNNFVNCILNKAKSNNLLGRYFSSIGVKANDLLYLSFLQHYCPQTPLLDFTHNLDVALFFATKGKRARKGSPIEDYVSLYYCSSNRFIQLDGILYDSMREIDKKNLDPSYESLPFNPAMHIDDLTCWMQPDGTRWIIPSIGLSFLPNPTRSKEISTYQRKERCYWSNLNLIAQDGCFMIHTSDIQSVEEYLWDEKIHELYEPKLKCVNIHRKLIPYIRKHLIPHLSERSLFPLGNSHKQNNIASQILDDVIKELTT